MTESETIVLEASSKLTVLMKELLRDWDESRAPLIRPLLKDVFSSTATADALMECKHSDDHKAFDIFKNNYGAFFNLLRGSGGTVRAINGMLLLTEFERIEFIVNSKKCKA